MLQAAIVNTAPAPPIAGANGAVFAPDALMDFSPQATAEGNPCYLVPKHAKYTCGFGF